MRSFLVKLALGAAAWHRRRLAEDPSQPWNVARRMAQEQERWYRENYQPVRGARRQG